MTGLLSRLRAGLGRSSKALGDSLDGLLGGRSYRQNNSMNWKTC